jgi:mevalonate kinase
MQGDNMNESDLVKKIKDYLKTIKDCFYWKEHGGQYGTAGIPDIIVCYRGRFLAFECKVGKNKATALQELTIRQIVKAGGYALVVRSVEEVKQIIEAFIGE